MTEVEVLIVGAGPTGLTLALWLTRMGVTVRIVDKTAEPGTTSADDDIERSPHAPPRDTLCASAEKDGRLFGAIQLINSKRAYDANHMEVLRYIGLTAAELLERVHNAD